MAAKNTPKLKTMLLLLLLRARPLPSHAPLLPVTLVTLAPRYVPAFSEHVFIWRLASNEHAVFYGLGSLLVYFPVPPFWEHLCI